MPRNSDTAPDAVETILETVMGTWEAFLKQLPMIAVGIVVIFLTYLANWLFKKSADRMFDRFEMRESLQQLLTRLTHIGIWTVGLMLAAMVMFPGMTLANALATLGLGSIAIGFAFKDIFENFFAGILILWRFPFENGDYIECTGVMGKVVDVTIRNTHIQKVSGELVVIPNAVIFKNPVDVLTNLPFRRMEVVAGVAYGEDVDAARKVIQKAVEKCRTVKHSQPIHILASEFASSSINFDVLWWTDPRPLAARESIDEVVAAIKRALDDAGIEIPFPYRTLTFKEPLHTVEDNVSFPTGPP